MMLPSSDSSYHLQFFLNDIVSNLTNNCLYVTFFMLQYSECGLTQVTAMSEMFMRVQNVRLKVLCISRIRWDLHICFSLWIKYVCWFFSSYALWEHPWHTKVRGRWGNLEEAQKKQVWLSSAHCFKIPLISGACSQCATKSQVICNLINVKGVRFFSFKNITSFKNKYFSIL